MSAHATPGLAINSRAYMALAKLQTIGGIAGLNAWMRAVAWEDQANAFRHHIVDKLLSHNAVALDLAAYVITEAGHQILGTPVNATPAAPPVPATARYVPPMRPLSSKNIARLVETRPGALDYLAVPSRIGDTRLAHGAKAPTIDDGGKTR